MVDAHNRPHADGSHHGRRGSSATLTVRAEHPLALRAQQLWYELEEEGGKAVCQDGRPKSALHPG